MSVSKGVSWGLGICIGICLFMVAGFVTCIFVGTSVVAPSFTKAAEQAAKVRAKVRATLETKEKEAEAEAEAEAAKAKEEASKAKEEALAYHSNLDIEIAVEYYEDTAYGRSVRIKGKVKNNGDRTVTIITMVIYLKDAQDNRIADHSYSPVSKYSIRDKRPLKPNYSKNFQWRWIFPLDDWAEWAEGSFDYEITEIKLGE